LEDKIIETNLTMQDFTEYFEKRKLGKFSFPNGRSFSPDVEDWVNLYVDLKDLYRTVVGWKINDTEVPLDDIIGVIAFGSAVRYPGYTKVPETRRKFLLFGEKYETGKMKRIPIDPEDVDFFVLTQNNITRHEYIVPGKATIDFGSGGCMTSITKGGINLVNRGIDQFLKGIGEGDTISVSAIKEGIPIFSDKQWLEKIIEQSGITPNTPRKVFWDETERGYLVGKIK